MYTVALVLVLVAIVLGDHECGPLQRMRIKNQWVEAYGYHGSHRLKMGRALWRNIFERAPDALPLFVNVRGGKIESDAFQAHIVRVFGGLDMCISVMTEEDTFNSQLKHLQSKHKARNVPSKFFEVMRDALIDILPSFMTRRVHFDQDSWMACFDVIANGIKV